VGGKEKKRELASRGKENDGRQRLVEPDYIKEGCEPPEEKEFSWVGFPLITREGERGTKGRTNWGIC